MRLDYSICVYCYSSTVWNIADHIKYKSNMETKREEITVQPIVASAKHDPGCRDVFKCVVKNIAAQRGQPMHNLEVVDNDQGLVVSSDPAYPATDHLFKIKASYKIGDRKRNYCLIIEDMQYDYETYVKYRIPPVKSLVQAFRELKLPIVWTNWARKVDDGLYGAVDRFYGSQGIDGQNNPCYIYQDNGSETMSELAPQNNEEMSRSIVSLHLSKFGDYDEEGREILFPMLEAWGVNTIVLCGAWTDDCLATTVFDAVDKYGYDVILISDGCATATIHGGKMMEVLYAATSLKMSAQEVVDHLKAHPELTEAPKAELNGDVRSKLTKYRHDPLLKEVEELRKNVKDVTEVEQLRRRVRDLEEELKLLKNK